MRLIFSPPHAAHTLESPGRASAIAPQSPQWTLNEVSIGVACDAT
jgi:hypothetical protein